MMKDLRHRARLTFAAACAAHAELAGRMLTSTIHFTEGT